MRYAALLLATGLSMFAASTTVDGHKIWYEATGAGEPVLVLVHGWTCDSTFWSKQTPEFAKHFRVLILDLPGHGKSDKPEVTYSAELFARSVLAVMDAAGVRRAVLVGHSMGLPVIRQVLATAPDRVVGLISVDGALVNIPRERRAGFDEYAASLLKPEGREMRRKSVESMFVDSTPRELREEITTKMLAAPPHVASSALRNSVASDLWSDAPATVPTLAINRRTKDGETQDAFRAAFTKLEYHEMDGVGHFLMMEKPGEFNAVVIDWVRKAAK